MPKKVTFDVTANTAGAKKGLDATGGALQGLQGILSKFGAPGQMVSDLLGKIGGAGLTAGVGVAAAAAAVALGAKEAEDAIKQYVDLGTEVEHYSQVSGESAEQSSREVTAFKELGVSTDTAAAGMFKLGKAAENTPAALAKVGIEVAKNVDGTVNLSATLENVITAWQSAGSAAEKDAIVFAAFGKAGAAMIPVLQANSKELARLEAAARTIYTAKDLADIREYRIASAELKQAQDDLGLSIGRLLLPAQKAVVDSMNESIYVAGHLAQAQAAANTNAAGSAHAQGAATIALQKQYEAAQEAARQADILTQTQTAAANAAMAEANAETILYNALNSSIDAGFAYRQSLLDLKKAQQDAANAKGKDAEANLRLEEAYKHVADAAVALATKQAEANGTTLTAGQQTDIYIASLTNLEKGLAPNSPIKKALDALIQQYRDLANAEADAARVYAGTPHAISKKTGVAIGSFAEGGTVPGPTGQAQLAIVHGGETVTPVGRSDSGGSGITVVIQGGIFMDHGPTLDRLTAIIARRLRLTTGI